MLVHSLQQVPFIQHPASTTALEAPVTQSPFPAHLTTPLDIPSPTPTPRHEPTQHPTKSPRPRQQPHLGPLRPEPPRPKPTQQLLRRRPPRRPNPWRHRPARDRIARSPALGRLGRRFSDERGRRRFQPLFGLRLRLGRCCRFLGGGAGAETAAWGVEDVERGRRGLGCWGFCGEVLGRSRERGRGGGAGRGEARWVAA